MRNADERTNLRAADTMNLKCEILKANKCNEKEMYPYIFIDRTSQARVNGIKVYIDIFSKYRKIIMQNQLYFLIADKDFKARFKTIDDSVAVEHETKKRKIQESTETDPKTETEPSKSFKPAKPSSSQSSGPDDRIVSVLVLLYTIYRRPWIPGLL